MIVKSALKAPSAPAAKPMKKNLVMRLGMVTEKVKPMRMREAETRRIVFLPRESARYRSTKQDTVLSTRVPPTPRSLR